MPPPENRCFLQNTQKIDLAPAGRQDSFTLLRDFAHAQTPKRPHVPTSKRPNVPTSKRPNVQTSPRPNIISCIKRTGLRGILNIPSGGYCSAIHQILPLAFQDDTHKPFPKRTGKRKRSVAPRQEECCSSSTLSPDFLNQSKR